MNDETRISEVPGIKLAEAKAAFEHLSADDRNERVRLGAQELAAVLQKYRLELRASASITRDGRIVAESEIVAMD